MPSESHKEALVEEKLCTIPSTYSSYLDLYNSIRLIANSWLGSRFNANIKGAPEDYSFHCHFYFFWTLKVLKKLK